MPEDNVLIIKSMTLEDTGEYKCEVMNEVETQAHTAIVDISGLGKTTLSIERTTIVSRYVYL